MDTIRRKNIKGKFTMIPNTYLERRDLSWEAKGIFAYLMSKPPFWEGRKDDILAHCPPMSPYAYRKIMRELQNAGILIKKIKVSSGIKGAKGTYYELSVISEVEYEVMP